MLTPEKEEQILAALKTKFQLDAYNVVTDEPLFDSENDIVDTICKTNTDDEQEVVYCRLALATFTDSETDGCDDDPVVTLPYNAHLFWEFREKRVDNTSPEKDLKALVLRLRIRFLNENRELLSDCDHTPLRALSNIILGADPLTGVHGFYIDLQTDAIVE